MTERMVLMAFGAVLALTVAFFAVSAIHGERFAVRWSDGCEAEDCTISIIDEKGCPPGAFVCPEQTNRTAACATCGLCWNTQRNVAFMEH